MKWFSFVVVAFAGLSLFFPSAAFTELLKPIEIKSISHINNSDVKETITFTLDAPVVPKIFTIGGENPRLVIDFPESIYLGTNVIALADGVLASAIRIGLHQTPVKRTRAVVDLSKTMLVHYASEYSKLDNSLTLTLTPDGNAQQAKASPDLQLSSLSQSTLPSQEELSTAHLDKKNVLPGASVKEETGSPAGEKVASALVPTILKISFDDSSSRGEMVLFRLNDFYPPTVSAIEKDNPRVLCDFMAMNLDSSVQRTIEVNGQYIERIRTARHHDPEKVRVVLDLLPNRDYDLQQVFFRNDNLFVLIVNELTSDQGAQ
ncbi:MAG: AMIN domain-containing protein [Desulfobulbaceae bacterium]|nr:AMIN domain-containing protein [Desulfobulbaceae bacterium]